MRYSAGADLAAAVRQAKAADKAEIYRRLGLALTYDSGKQKVLVEMNLNQHYATTRGLPVSGSFTKSAGQQQDANLIMGSPGHP